MDATDVVQNVPSIWPQIIQLVSLLATVAAAVAAALAAKDSRRAVMITDEHASQTMKNEVLQLHIHFQTQIRELQKLLPPEVNDAGWKPSVAEKRTIRMYWYAVFDEWLSTTRLGSNTKHMWDDYYRNGVKGAFKNHAFVEELREMFDGPTVFLGALDFRDELNAISQEVHGVKIT